MLCPECDAVFVKPSERVSPEKEKERYETHQNDSTAAGYVDFLQKTISQIQKNFSSGSRILDFGSGPNPLMSELLRAQNYEVVSYDPYFLPDAPREKFDVVLAHEVFEHFREPVQELAKIQGYLKSEGTFLIHSSLRPDDFTNWWYARDFTHIFFCSEKTLRWIAKKYSWKFEFWSPQLWAFSAPHTQQEPGTL